MSRPKGNGGDGPVETGPDPAELLNDQHPCPANHHDQDTLPPHPTSHRELVQYGKDYETHKQQDAKWLGPCPLCQQENTPDSGHLYTKFFPAWGGSLQWPSLRLANCPNFAAKSPADRHQLITRLGVCKRCSSWMHGTGRCPLHHLSCGAVEGDKRCRDAHLPELHDCLRPPAATGGPGGCDLTEGSPTQHWRSPPLPQPPTTRTPTQTHPSLPAFIRPHTPLRTGG